MVVYKSLSAKADQNGFSQVMFRVQKGRAGFVRVKSNVFVPIQFWNEKKQAVTIPQKIGANIKTELQTIKENLDIAEKRTVKLIEMYGDVADKSFIEGTLQTLKDYNGIITTEIVTKARIAEEEKRKQDLLLEQDAEKDLFRYCEPFLSKGLCDARVRLYRVIFRSMARYAVYRNKIALKPFVWNIDKVTRNDIEDLFDYFAHESEYRVKYKKVFDKEKVIYNEEIKLNRKRVKIEQRGENRLIDMKKGVKAFWHFLIETKRTVNNPVDGIKVGVQKYGDPYFLTLEERNIIADHDFTTNKHLSTQRDIFVFQCLIGCRVGDLTKLTCDNIVDDILIYTPHKTKDGHESVVANVPLNERALRLIKKYKDQDSAGRLFPYISDQKYNDAIKDILTECGITRMVNVRNAKTGESEMKPINEIGSSHMARRTFAGNAYKLVQDPNIVGKMTGHVEGSKAISRYRVIDIDIMKSITNSLN